MVKEASTGGKQKNSRSLKDDKIQQEDTTRQTNPNPKRDASSRSPLEGNPGKKQKESMDKDKTNWHEIMKDKCDKDNEAALPTLMPQEQSTSNNQSIIEEEEELTTTKSLLCKLKDIKDMILKLDVKVKLNHQDLSSRVSDFSEVKELIALQNDKKNHVI